MKTFLFALGTAILIAADGMAADVSKPKPYELDYCLYSGDKLGEMGAPTTEVYAGQEFKFCCQSCESAFGKDRAAGLKKYEAAVQAKSAAK